MIAHKIRWLNLDEVLAGEVAKLWEIGILTDTKIRFKGEIFKVHKIILYLVSPYFKDIFSSDRYLDDPYEMLQDDITVEEFKAILKYIYTGKKIFWKKKIEVH